MSDNGHAQAAKLYREKWESAERVLELMRAGVDPENVSVRSARSMSIEDLAWVVRVCTAELDRRRAALAPRSERATSERSERREGEPGPMTRAQRIREARLRENPAPFDGDEAPPAAPKEEAK